MSEMLNSPEATHLPDFYLHLSNDTRLTVFIP